MHTKSTIHIEDAKERQKAIQNSYYKRRGFFLAYRRKLAHKLSVDVSMLDQLTTLEHLDDFSKEYLKYHYQIDVSYKPTQVLLQMV